MLPTLAAAAAFTILPGFHSPSGNISCYLGPPKTLRCTIGTAAYAKALQRRCTSSTTVDWHGWELRPTGPAHVTCSGGILFDPSRERPGLVNLPYGKTWTHGGFTCASATAGITCRNRTGNVLFISRQAWRTS